MCKCEGLEGMNEKQTNQFPSDLHIYRVQKLQKCHRISFTQIQLSFWNSGRHKTPGTKITSILEFQPKICSQHFRQKRLLKRLMNFKPTTFYPLLGNPTDCSVAKYACPAIQSATPFFLFACVVILYLLNHIHLQINKELYVFDDDKNFFFIDQVTSSHDGLVFQIN